MARACALAAKGLAAFLLAAGLAACEGGSAAGKADTAAAKQSGAAELRAIYRRPGAVPFPKDNPYSADKAQLGEMLFFDARLSGANALSCAGCHLPSLSWVDAVPKGLGHGLKPMERRTQTLLNVAWTQPLFWDGSRPTLEEQALAEIAAPAVMNQPVGALVTELGEIGDYRARFKIAFPEEGMTARTIAQALATFARTIVSGPAPFDRWVNGEEDAISAAAKRGFQLFSTKANCAACHTGWNFTDNRFHDIGLPDADIGRARYDDRPSMNHAFKTPTLRDVARRGPYMHDGSVKDLAAAIEHFNRGGAVKGASLSREMRPLDLAPAEIADLVEFLSALTGEQVPQRFPILPVADQPNRPRQAARN